MFLNTKELCEINMLKIFKQISTFNNNSTTQFFSLNVHAVYIAQTEGLTSNIQQTIQKHHRCP